MAQDRAMEPREVVFVVFPDLQGLDLLGPAEVFAAANQHTGRSVYRSRVVATAAGPLPTTSGVTLVVDEAIADVAGPVDTLMVVGGDGTVAALRDHVLVDHVTRLASEARRITSVCSGA